MRIGLRIDQLSINTNLSTRPPDASFEQVTHAQFAPNPPRVDGLVLVSEGGIARNYQAVPDPRQIGRQILSNPIGEILLFGVVTEGSPERAKRPKHFSDRNNQLAGHQYRPRRQLTSQPANRVCCKQSHRRCQSVTRSAKLRPPPNRRQCARSRARSSCVSGPW